MLGLIADAIFLPRFASVIRQRFYFEQSEDSLLFVIKVCFLENVLGERVFCRDFDDNRSGLGFDVGFLERLPTVDFLDVGLFVSRMILGLWMWKYSILMGSWDLMFIRGCFFVDFDFFFYVGLTFSSTYFFALI